MFWGAPQLRPAAHCGQLLGSSQKPTAQRSPTCAVPLLQNWKHAMFSPRSCRAVVMASEMQSQMR